MVWLCRNTVEYSHGIGIFKTLKLDNNKLKILHSLFKVVKFSRIIFVNYLFEKFSSHILSLTFKLEKKLKKIKIKSIIKTNLK